MIIDSENILNKVARTYKTPIFAALGGDRSYGIYCPDTPYIIAGCYAASIVDEANLNGVIPDEPHHLHKAPKADAPLNWEMQEVAAFIKRLKANDITALEEIHSPLLFLETAKFRELKELTRATLSKSLYPVILERIEKKRRMYANMESPTNSILLELARVYMQGIYLFRLKKFVVNLKRLNEYFDLFIVTRILDEMNQKSEKYFIGQSSETESLFEFLHDEFNQAYNYSTLPDSADNQEKLLNAYLRSMR
jgi:hypothetical protein